MHVHTPSAEHAWLTRLLGRWASASETVAGHEDHPPASGEETFRAFGDLWVQGDGDAGWGRTQMTLGFDPVRGRFVGTFVGATMTHLWVYDGEQVGPDKLALYATGPSFYEEGKSALYRDEIEFVSPDERTLRAFVQRSDGSWSHFMQTRYRRLA